MPSLADLQWGMFPYPYLASVGPDAAPGSVVYRLSARQRGGSLGNAQFLLLDGEWSRIGGSGCSIGWGWVAYSVMIGFRRITYQIFQSYLLDEKGAVISSHPLLNLN